MPLLKKTVRDYIDFMHASQTSFDPDYLKAHGFSEKEIHSIELASLKKPKAKQEEISLPGETTSVVVHAARDSGDITTDIMALGSKSVIISEPPREVLKEAPLSNPTKIPLPANTTSVVIHHPPSIASAYASTPVDIEQVDMRYYAAGKGLFMILDVIAPLEAEALEKQVGMNRLIKILQSSKALIGVATTTSAVVVKSVLRTMIDIWTRYAIFHDDKSALIAFAIERFTERGLNLFPETKAALIEFVDNMVRIELAKPYIPPRPVEPAREAPPKGKTYEVVFEKPKPQKLRKPRKPKKPKA